MFEAGYGPEDAPAVETAIFDTRDQAQAWVESHIDDINPTGFVRPVAPV